jgi:SPP1 gp7 family putative phage head morphogenesis protein
MPRIFLDPIIYRDAWHNDLARYLIANFYETIFKPLLDALDDNRLDNAKESALEKALKEGRVTFQDGIFKGDINARISKQIKEMGGKFVRGYWRIESPRLPTEIQKAIAFFIAANRKLEKKFEEIFLTMPEKVSDMVKNLSVKSMGVQGLNRVSVEFKHKLNKAVSVYPDIGKDGHAQITREYYETKDKPIKEKLLHEYENGIIPACRDFSEEIVEKLRRDLHDKILGGRSRKEIQKFIMERLHVSKTRAKFIARQETALLTVSFQKAHYQQAGINKYQWITVGDHVVRGTRKSDSGDHVSLDRQFYSWDNPPDARYFSTKTPCHPGEDYRCRCQARPVVEW